MSGYISKTRLTTQNKKVTEEGLNGPDRSKKATIPLIILFILALKASMFLSAFKGSRN